MADKDFTSLLGKSAGTSWGEIAGAYLTRGRKEDNRARNVLLATLFFNAKEAQMQNQVLKNLQENEKNKTYDKIKLAETLNEREKLLLDNKGYEDEGRDYFFVKAKNKYNEKYSGLGIDFKNYSNAQSKIKDINEMADEYEKNHLTNMKNIERSDKGRILTKEEILGNVDEYYANKQKMIASPDNISLVHKGFKKIKGIIGKDKKTEYELKDKAYTTSYNNIMGKINESYMPEKYYDKGTGKVFTFQGSQPFSQEDLQKQKQDLKNLQDPDKSEFITNLRKSDFSMPIMGEDNKPTEVNIFEDNFNNIKVYNEDGSENPMSRTTFFDAVTLTSLQIQKSRKQVGEQPLSTEQLFVDSIRVLSDTGHLKIKEDRWGTDDIEFIPLGLNYENKVKNNTASVMDVVAHQQQNGKTQEQEIANKSANEIFDNYISKSISTLQNSRRGLNDSQQNKLNNLIEVSNALEQGNEELYSKSLIKFVSNPPMGLGNIKASFDDINKAYEAHMENFGRDKEVEDILFSKYTISLRRGARNRLEKNNINTYAQLMNLEPLFLAQN
jgi:hypothetical protein